MAWIGDFGLGSVAEEYKDIIPLEVYEALLNYRVLLENDKNYVA